VGGLDLRDDSCIDVVVVLYAIDALWIDSKKAESLSQSPENGIGVFLPNAIATKQRSFARMVSSRRAG
jgi:hypothetical protein